jgi:uncharacterized membrane protein
MFPIHSWDAWLVPAARETAAWRWVRLIGGSPAPLFLFLAGVSLALAAEAGFRKGMTPAEVARDGGRRALQVLGYALAFRVWMLVMGGFQQPRAFLRADILNCIGLTMALVALVGLRPATWTGRLLACLGLGGVVAALAPLAWDAAWPAWIPWPILAYVSGRGEGGAFPLFPWAAFTAAGAATGLVLARARERSGRAVLLLAAAGIALCLAGWEADRILPHVYARYDFWYTSPSYVAIRVGLILVALGVAWVMDRIPGWSPLRQLGRTSLLVYWLHIEVVYGSVIARGLKHALDVREAAVGTLVLAISMLAVSLARTNLPRIRRFVNAGTTSVPSPG